jgi:hypothetical protein
MDPEFHDIEDTLKGLRPLTPDAACMDRLLAAVEGRLQQGDAPQAGLERSLSGMRPLAMPTDVAERMLETVSRVPFPVDEKVVLFPGAAKPLPKESPRLPWYAAAAAVAVAGAFSAFMIGGGDAPPRVPLAGQGASPAVEGFVPASVGTGLDGASDEGVRWTADGKPVRMVRVIYKDRVKYRNAEGGIIEVERPRVEYLMVPEKID